MTVTLMLVLGLIEIVFRIGLVDLFVAQILFVPGFLVLFGALFLASYLLIPYLVHWTKLF